MRPITLSPRLRSVGELIPAGSRYADVGTDHAYLPVWLLQCGIVTSAIVSDLRQGPLDRARQTAQRYDLTDRISFRLCDGLAGIAPEEVDAVSISGMGGETIAAILEAAPWAGAGARSWVLQPMSAAEDLRAWLTGHGFLIEQEILTEEGRSLYVTLLARPGKALPLTPAERWAGRQWQAMDAPLRGPYLARLLRRAYGAFEGVRRSNKEEDGPRAAELKAVYEGLLKMKKEWDAWQR